MDNDYDDGLLSDDNLAGDLLWGAVAIGQYIGKDEPRDVYYLLEKQYLPAKKIGGQWVGSRRAIRRALLAAA